MSRAAVTRKIYKTLGTVFVVALILAISAEGPEWLDRLKEILDTNISYGLYLAMMAVLPIFGFPASLFLLLGGARFGFGWSFLAMAITFPAHLLAIYLVAHSFLRPRVEAFLNRRHHSLPRIPRHRQVLYTTLMAAIPSLPYPVKNYLLALGGVPLRTLYKFALPIHLVVGAAFIMLGKLAMSFNITLFLVLIAAIGLGGLMLGRLRKSMEVVEKKTESDTNPETRLVED